MQVYSGNLQIRLMKRKRCYTLPHLLPHLFTFSYLFMRGPVIYLQPRIGGESPFIGKSKVELLLGEFMQVWHKARNWMCSKENSARLDLQLWIPEM